MERTFCLILTISLVLQAQAVMAQDVRQLPLLTTATNTDVDPGEREIRNEERHLRFCVRQDWNVKYGAGIWIISSPDSKVLSVVTLLDDPKEVPAAIAELDKLVGVQRTEFGKPKSGVHRGIPTELLSGRGVLARSDSEVAVTVLTMFVYDAPVLVTTLVHADVVKKRAEQISRYFESFALLVTPEEAKELETRAKRVDPSLLQ
jgi:hypothetical protein